ncbi:uncharacterized protein MYCFIDRAFT_208630 [Pseudocercospora fijiensis CIRAD86]|uniref:Uncharacterized protein n=1 Tax=Pseudocercospora fijiensis (strain CIRAD86) TaxID=383855 RepID=M3AU37_PSEFD|nr:uncharacterized protein MYCFIDRAFT_208630 [Pseudocercospora fijiensis CIRAD86]EME80658.1 hypothetical protein MYCFIDRAFT_208630 [Pseudocercospora fijiensis CIRAD86]
MHRRRRFQEFRTSLAENANMEDEWSSFGAYVDGYCIEISGTAGPSEGSVLEDAESDTTRIQIHADRRAWTSCSAGQLRRYCCQISDVSLGFSGPMSLPLWLQSKWKYLRRRRRSRRLGCDGEVRQTPRPNAPPLCRATPASNFFSSIFITHHYDYDTPKQQVHHCTDIGAQRAGSMPMSFGGMAQGDDSILTYTGGRRQLDHTCLGTSASIWLSSTEERGLIRHRKEGFSIFSAGGELLIGSAAANLDTAATARENPKISQK